MKGVTIQVIDGTDGDLLGCDCYGGCWGDHSKNWPALRFPTTTYEEARGRAREAARLTHQNPDGTDREKRTVPYGGKVVTYKADHGEVRFATKAMRDAHHELLKQLWGLP